MKLLLKLKTAALLLIFTTPLCAQQNKPATTTIPAEPDAVTVRDTTIKNKSVPQKDISDVFVEGLHLKSGKKNDSITSKPSISVAPGIGYNLVSKLAIVVAGNITYRSAPMSRISTIVATISVTQKKQFTLPILSNIWSKDNSYKFVGDMRLYSYPQNTYGLGSSSNIHREDALNYEYARFYEIIYHHIAGNFYAGGGYIVDTHWNVTDKGYYNDYADYGKSSHSIATGFTLNTLYDSRDNAINPRGGGYATLQYRDNAKGLGSTTSWQSLIIDVRKYINLPAGSNNVLALWSYDWLILNGKPAYLDLPSTQWDALSATGRGYIQGRFRGAQMVYAEGEYRFALTANGLLGGVFFLNAQSFSAAPGTRLQSIQPGYGPGLRIKLSTVTKTNVCLDYGFGRQGSNGLFVAVGEIF